MKVEYEPIQAHASLIWWNLILSMVIIAGPDCVGNRFDFYWMFGSSGPLYLKITFVTMTSTVTFFPLSLTAIFKLTEYFSN